MNSDVYLVNFDFLNKKIFGFVSLVLFLVKIIMNIYVYVFVFLGF